MENQHTLNWMHISDLHRGQDRTKEVWAVVRQEIKDDVVRHIEEHGPLDLIIFSGDMAFKGTSEEFESVFDELIDLWNTIEAISQPPKLFIVPGNHDLERPSKTSPMLNMADMLRLKTDVRDEILSGQDSIYRTDINTAFNNYQNFIKRVHTSSIELLEDCAGLLPGDSSAQFEANGLRVGLVGINTAWTHLGAGEKKGKLEVSVQQLNSVVNDNLPKWAKSNHVNLLITHHPSDWLNSESFAEFNSEIFHTDYFHAHLFGHTHETVPEMKIVGSQQKRILQAASLFGLEKIDGEVDRRHGYYFAKLRAEDDRCEIWPRRLQQKNQSIWQIAAETDLLHRDEKSLFLPWPIRETSELTLKKH